MRMRMPVPRHAPRVVERPVAVRGPAALRQVDGRQARPAHGVLGDRVGDGLGVDEVRVVVQVGDRVPGLVVVGVVGGAGLAAEQGGFFGRLEDFGAGEQATGGDTVLDEALGSREG